MIRIVYIGLAFDVISLGLAGCARIWAHETMIIEDSCLVGAFLQFELRPKCLPFCYSALVSTASKLAGSRVSSTLDAQSSKLGVIGAESDTRQAEIMTEI